MRLFSIARYNRSQCPLPNGLRLKNAGIRLSLTALLLTLIQTVHSDDWPTYRGSNLRTGGTDSTISTPLSGAWTYESSSIPRLAWSSGEGRVIEGKLLGHRVKFDDALHPIAVNGRIYFGSSVDHQLRCLDLKTGKELWTFFADAPIRLAPTHDNGMIYFGSDDGHAYCLQADTGKLVWKLRAGREDNWLLARGEMISRWPVRTGVLVDEGVAYFGAGIFPHEDVYVYAVDSKTGSIIWKQDNVSTQDAGRNDLSPQGYLLIHENKLIVPSGRSLPAVINKETGKVLYKRTMSFRSEAGGIIGGSRAMIADGQLYVSGPHRYVAVSLETKRSGFGWFEGEQMAIHGEFAYLVDDNRVAKLNRSEYAKSSSKSHKLELQASKLQRSLMGSMYKAKAISKANAKKAKEIEGKEIDDKTKMAIAKAKAEEEKANQAVLTYKKKIADAYAEMKKLSSEGIDWQTKASNSASVLPTGNLLFTGGVGQVTAYSNDSGEQVWQAEVKGEARGLVVVDGHLLVSTTTGAIYCFAKGDHVGKQTTPKSSPLSDLYPKDQLTEKYESAASSILERATTKKGFCLVLDAHEGRLAYALSQQSELKIYAVCKDAEQAAKTRKRLSKAGLYGHRITVHHQTKAELPYSNYFANLIVSDQFVVSGKSDTDFTKIVRHLKPLGGVLCLGTASSSKPAPELDKIFSQIEQEKLPDQVRKQSTQNWTSLKRGALPGAGDWTHQYGNPANTAISNDRRVKSGLGVLWYGDPGPGEMVNRHSGAVGPLAVNGKLIVQGETTILAYDAYNGVFLWKYENPEAIRLGVFKGVSPGNLAASKDRLFHILRENCYELNSDTGKIEAVHKLPKDKDDGKHQWGYVAVQDGLLYGTATVMEDIAAAARRRGRKTNDATDAIFAIDLKKKKHLWMYQGSSISHRTIAIGPEKLYFIDSSITSDQRAAILREDKSELVNLTGKAREIAEDRLKKADLRRAVGINARSGKVLWSHPVDVTDCSEIGIGGGMLNLMYQDGVLILGGANANGHYWRQFVAGEFSRRRLVALSAEDGYKLWSKDANYRSRPIIIGSQVLAEPWSFDLKSGEQKMRTHPVTGKQVPWSIMRTGHHCGMLTGCDSGMLMFRSGYTGFYDLESDAGTRHFAGHRLGCWINAIPANGLVMIPEASAGCVCLFSIASTIVLEPREAHHPWAIYSSVGAQTPVQHLALNLGAPGDRKDDSGTVWLSYPRYRAYQETSLDIKLDLKPQFADGGGFRDMSEESTTIDGSPNSWLYLSAAKGIKKFSIPLLGKKDSPAKYDVKLHFVTGQSASSFLVKLQDKTAFENITLDKSVSKSRRQAITKIASGVTVTDNLTVQLEPISGTASLCGIEITRAE